LEEAEYLPVAEFEVMPSSSVVVVEFKVVPRFLATTDCKSVPSLDASVLLVELFKVDINDTFRFGFNFAEVLDTTAFDEDVRSFLSGADFEVVSSFLPATKLEVVLCLLVTEIEVIPSLAVSDREEGPLSTIEPRGTR
jgi:hypothetical protein